MRKYRIFSVLSAVLLCFMLTFSGCGASNNDNHKLKDMDESKILIAYFSCTENTKKVAQYIQTSTNGDIYRIIEKDKYTADDLDYTNSNCRANTEQNDSNVRPEIESETISNMGDYDIIFLGYPIWWGKAPKIIYTFLESYDLSNKTIVPFCTSSSSGIKGSLSEIKILAKKSTWLNGERFSMLTSEDDVDTWLETLK